MQDSGQIILTGFFFNYVSDSVNSEFWNLESLFTLGVTNKGVNNNHNNNPVILNIIMLPVLEKIRTGIGKVW